jgi:uncharacterized membrane protein
MNEAPVELIVAAFQDEHSAEATLKELKLAKKEKLIRIQGAAILRRDQKNKLHVKDVDDVGGGRGAVAGAILAAAIALVTAGTGVVLMGAVGALVGGLAAKSINLGLPKDRLKALGDELKPGTSAIIAIIEHRWVADLEAELAAAGGRVVMESLKADIAAQLEAGKDVAYSAIADESSASITRTAGDDEMVEVEELTVTDEGVSAQATLVTEEGAITRAMAVSDEGFFAVEAGVTEEGAVVEGVAVTGDEVVHGQAVLLPDEADEDGEG